MKLTIEIYSFRGKKCINLYSVQPYIYGTNFMVGAEIGEMSIIDTIISLEKDYGFLQKHADLVTE